MFILALIVILRFCNFTCHSIPLSGRERRLMSSAQWCGRASRFSTASTPLRAIFRTVTSTNLTKRFAARSSAPQLTNFIHVNPSPGNFHFPTRLTRIVDCGAVPLFLFYSIANINIDLRRSYFFNTKNYVQETQFMQFIFVLLCNTADLF